MSIPLSVQETPNLRVDSCVIGNIGYPVEEPVNLLPPSPVYDQAVAHSVHACLRYPIY